jgi:hypothetical protein
LQPIASTEEAMRYLTTKSNKIIRQAIDFVTLHRRPITLKTQGDQTLFDSVIVKAEHGDPFSRLGLAKRPIVDWLSPAKGNDLIQSTNPIEVRFSLAKSQCEFISFYVTRSVESPYFGNIISYPESLAIGDRRRQDRHEIDSESTPLFVNARLRTKATRSREKSYDLDIFDVCEKGVGILVGKDLYDFLERIRVGDRLMEVELYAPWSIVKVDGTVKHKSKISEGKYKGYHVLGIELDEKLEHYVWG